MATTRVLIDTNVLIGPAPVLRADQELSVSSITYAELEAGTRLARDTTGRALRVRRLAAIRQVYGAGLPFDDRAATSFALMVDVLRGSGRTHRSRTADLMIAATAHVHGASLLTHNVDDFQGLEGLLTVLDAGR